MARELKPSQKPYSPPSFEMLNASAARAEPKARGEPKDATVRQMISLIDGQRKKKKAKLHP